MPLNSHKDGVTLNIRLTPAGRKDGFAGVMEIEDGKRAVKASVTAPPEDGKANKALLVLLAKSLKLPKSAFSLLSGETNRQKVVLISGDTARLTAQLQTFLASLGES